VKRLQATYLRTRSAQLPLPIGRPVDSSPEEESTGRPSGTGGWTEQGLLDHTVPTPGRIAGGAEERGKQSGESLENYESLTTILFLYRLDIDNGEYG